MKQLDKINFLERLHSFVKNVNVNDAMSMEEKEMILRIATSEMKKKVFREENRLPTEDEIIKYCKEVFKNTEYSGKQQIIAFNSMMDAIKWYKSITEEINKN